MEKDCVKEYQEMMMQQGVEGIENEVICSEDNDFIHCEAPYCHTLYWKDNNGAVCGNCFINVCELCSCDEKSTFMYGEDFLCESCLILRVNTAKIDYCQNTKKNCKNFVYLGKCNQMPYQCDECKISLCNECEGDVLFKNKCLNCRRRRSKKKPNK